jgi:hypothetical protein
VALIPAAYLGWRRLWATGLLAGGLTAAAQGPSHAVWIWWVPLVAGLAALLALAYPACPGSRVRLTPPDRAPSLTSTPVTQGDNLET